MKRSDIMPLFNEYKLNEKTLNAIENIHFKEPTKTQQMVLPHALENKNLVPGILQSRTLDRVAISFSDA